MIVLTKKHITALLLLLLHELEANEYRKIKDENGSTIACLEIQLNEVNIQKSAQYSS